MLNQSNRLLKLITAITLFGAFSLSTQAAFLLDGGFEENANDSPWTFTPNAELTGNAAISGNQSAFLSNEGLSPDSFAVAFQTILLDGSDLSVGDEIFLTGLAQIVSQLGSLDRMYIELAFRNSEVEEILGEVGDVDFVNAVSADALFDTILVQTLTTSSIVIPELVTSGNGDTLATKGIRIAVAIFTASGNDLTQANFDNLKLQRVPTPSIFALLLIAVGFVATRKRVLL